jgi:hypothetical protein
MLVNYAATDVEYATNYLKSRWMREVSKFSCEIKALLMISARFLRDSVNDNPPIDDGELGIVQALQIKLILKQSDPAARMRTYCGF